MTLALGILGLLAALLALLVHHERRRARWREHHEARMAAYQERAVRANGHPHTGQVQHLGRHL